MLAFCEAVAQRYPEVAVSVSPSFDPSVKMISCVANTQIYSQARRGRNHLLDHISGNWKAGMIVVRFGIRLGVGAGIASGGHILIDKHFVLPPTCT
jgi:hypothetical protein